MTDVIVFQHAQGLTDGVDAIADHLRAAGHQVTVPDLYDGRTFDKGLPTPGSPSACYPHNC